MLDVCDELGMLVIDESAIYASWQMLVPEHPQFMATCREHLARWVRRDRNHPAVVLWSAENEGLNVNVLSPAKLAEFRRVIDEDDGTRPVIFRRRRLGLRCHRPASSIMFGPSTTWATAAAAPRVTPATCATTSTGPRSTSRTCPSVAVSSSSRTSPSCAPREREAVYAMGLQARGYRLADWFDIRPYNPSYGGFCAKRESARASRGLRHLGQVLRPSGRVRQGLRRTRARIPKPPTLKAGEAARRTLLIYNDAFTDEQVQVSWQAKLADRRIGGGERTLQIPLGNHAIVEITFTPDSPGELRLELISSKAGREQFRDVRPFSVE